MKRNDLIFALEKVKPGLSNREIIEGTTAFAFMGDRVVTYNDEISISHPIPDMEITGAVKATELYSLLQKIKTEDIEITVTETELLIDAGRSHAAFSLQTEIKLPLEEISTIGKWKTLPENFVNSVRRAMYSCARSSSKPLLTCVHVNQEGFVEGSDNFRITRCTLSERMPVKTFLIPVSSVQELLKLDPIKISEGQGWVHFKTAENTIISCRTIEDVFPNCTEILKVTGTEITFPKTIWEALDCASVFSKRDNSLDEEVSILLEDKHIKIQSSSETGRFEEVSKIKYEGKPISFLITPGLLNTTLAETLTCICGEKMLKFAGEDWEYVVMLRYGK